MGACIETPTWSLSTYNTVSFLDFAPVLVRCQIDMPPPSQVPVYVFPSVQDIKLYTLNGSQTFLTGTHLCKSANFNTSNQSTSAARLSFTYRWLVCGRSRDFFTILDHVVRVPSVHYRLQKLDAPLPVYRLSLASSGCHYIIPHLASIS